MEESVTDYIRTDLALEMKEAFHKDVEIEGVEIKEELHNNIKVSRVVIRTEHGAKAMKKPQGTYLTVECSDIEDKQDEEKWKLSEVIAKLLKELGQIQSNHKVLFLGLGNRMVTADSLGPNCAEKLLVTRHLFREFGASFGERQHLLSVSALAPGVMAQTGMEVFEILRGVVRETKPDLIIVVDALAARSTKRLNSTVQMTDTGISPGAGIGNNRQEISEKSIGTKVIAVGVPTVVDCATIVRDRMEASLRGQGLTEDELQRFLSEISENEVEEMFVTPKNIDEALTAISEVIANALNLCFSTGGYW